MWLENENDKDTILSKQNKILKNNNFSMKNK
jgi:hypothetical protein